MMTDDLKAFQQKRLIRVHAGLVQGNTDLLKRCVHTLQIRQQQAPPMLITDDHTIALDIQLDRKSVV